MTRTPLPPVDIVAVGMTTPVGLDAQRAAAAIRAGICRSAETSFENEDSEPQVMSLVGDEYLPVLHPALPEVGRAAATARTIQLGTYALAEACAPCPIPPPLLLALREEDGIDQIEGPAFIRDLATQARVELDLRNSRLYRQGGAAGLFALRDAMALLASDRVPCVLVGGVDTMTDPGQLRELDREGRLLGRSIDGFIPGEGAAFLLLTSPSTRRRLRLEPFASVVGVGLGSETGHRYSSEPYRGDGLDAAFKDLFASLPTTIGKVETVYAGFNGESLPSKEWGVAYLRSNRRFAENPRIEHPADCLGDAGAALGPIMLGLAAIGIRRAYRKPPLLVWSTSDREPRGAAMLLAATI